MIIGISGWQRSFKTGLGSAIAKYELRDYNIQSGYGNLTLLTMPYDYTKLNSRPLMNKLFETFDQGLENRMFFIDEAHRILNPRLWKDWTKQDTMSLAGIYQDDKLNNVILYTYHPGKPGEELLGVDKMLRAATFLEIEILSDQKLIISHDAIVYRLIKYFMNEKVVIDKVLENVSQYFHLFLTKEPVV